jgi:hypothetical protein
VLGNSVVEQNRRDAPMKFLLFARFRAFHSLTRETILTELNARFRRDFVGVVDASAAAPRVRGCQF